MDLWSACNLRTTYHIKEGIRLAPAQDRTQLR